MGRMSDGELCAQSDPYGDRLISVLVTQFTWLGIEWACTKEATTA